MKEKQNSLEQKPDWQHSFAEFNETIHEHEIIGS